MEEAQATNGEVCENSDQGLGTKDVSWQQDKKI